MLSWVIASVAVGLPIVFTAVMILRGVLKERSLGRLARSAGWDDFRGAGLSGPAAKGVRHSEARRGRAAAPLRSVGESVDRGVVGAYRDRPFALYRYLRAGAGFNQDGTRESGSRRTVVHVEVSSPTPDCVLSVGRFSSRMEISNGEVELRPDIEAWLVRNCGRYRRFSASDHTLAVELRSSPGKRQLLRALDFLTDAAERLPLFQPTSS